MSPTPHPAAAEKGGGAAGAGKRLLVIDEVGKMELFSRDFVERVKNLFDTAASPTPLDKGVEQGGVVLLATIPVQRQRQNQHWLLESIRRRKDCWFLEVRLRYISIREEFYILAIYLTTGD